MIKKQELQYLLHPAVIVSALGYFVDIYDLILFSIVRVPSLKDLGIEGDALFSDGLLLINLQMSGMLIGGILWGILGDKKGRISVLFGSILLYSTANILNGMVTSVSQYAALRFIAGIGLAGELGAGITLVAEILPKAMRGMGTTLVASVGVCGAVLAALIAESFHWRTAYYIGGGLGLSLLALRYGVIESGMFSGILEKPIKRGSFFSLFTSWSRFNRYIRSILIGVPLWFVVGILVTFSPEFGKEFGIAEPISAGRSIMFAYLGLAVGDLGSGLLSQFLRSRKKAVGFFLVATLVSVLVYLLAPLSSPNLIYLSCLFMGISVGYWAVFVTIGAEQFGTNLRATVATTVPNFVRGSLVPLSALFGLVKSYWGLQVGALFVGGITLLVAFVALYGLQETFDKDLDYLE